MSQTSITVKRSDKPTTVNGLNWGSGGNNADGHLVQEETRDHASIAATYGNGVDLDGEIPPSKVEIDWHKDAPIDQMRADALAMLSCHINDEAVAAKLLDEAIAKVPAI